MGWPQNLPGDCPWIHQPWLTNTPGFSYLCRTLLVSTPTPPPPSRLGFPPQPHSLGTSVSGGPKEQSMGWRGTRGGSPCSQAGTPLWGSLTVRHYLSRLRFPPFPRQLHSWHERVKSACPRQPMAARSAFAAPPNWRMHRVGGEEAPVPWDALKRLWLGSRATRTGSPRP